MAKKKIAVVERVLSRARERTDELRAAKAERVSELAHLLEDGEGDEASDVEEPEPVRRAKKKSRRR